MYKRKVGRRSRDSLSTFRSARSGQTTHFFETPLSIQEAPAGLCRAEFETDDPNVLVKRALLMVEGDHIDSAKRHHSFPAARIRRIAANTNAFISKFGRVPWQKDHAKTQDANIGDLEGEVEVRRITPADLPHPNLKHLVGRLGIFTDSLIAKGQDVIEQINAGRIKTLSPGIDTATDIIREISATPTPAIVGLMTFRRGQDREARFTSLTMEEAEVELADMDALKNDAHDLLDLFLKVNEAILTATEDELEGQDPFELQAQAISDFVGRLEELMGVTNDAMAPPDMEEPDPTQPSTAAANSAPTGRTAPAPGYTQRQQGIQMSDGLVLAAFSIADMEHMLKTAEFRRIRRDKGRKRSKRTLRQRVSNKIRQMKRG